MATVRSAAPAFQPAQAPVSVLSLYLLRGAYLLLVVGLAFTVWPNMLAHTTTSLTLSPWPGIGNSMLAALPVVALLGLRYPLKMLPLLFFEMTWKAIWLLFVALPLWTSHAHVDDQTAATIQACLMAVIFPFLIPWRYVISTYLLQPGDRWR